MMADGMQSEYAAMEGDIDRSAYTAQDTIEYLWTGLGLPSSALNAVSLPGTGLGLPSSFKLGHLAQASITLSALAAALVDSLREPGPVRKVEVDVRHAVLEFLSERYHSMDGKHQPQEWGPIGGLHKTADGHVRVHDVWHHHAAAALRILGLAEDASRGQVEEKMKDWDAADLEKAAAINKAVIYKLRSFAEWDVLPQAQAVPKFPIIINKIGDQGIAGIPDHMPKLADRCLRGLRVLDLSRVIAAPVCGRTLAAHGADVLWVTSPNLTDRPFIDRDVHRGKHAIALDLNGATGRDTRYRLVKDADVFIQSYRPGSLAAKGFSPSDLAKINPRLIYANLSAWGSEGPWAFNRGFDSLVQTASGMNVSEARHFGDDSAAARPTPCQALDHGAGYLLATGVIAAVYKRATEGGSWEVNVCLAGVMRYLRSLGQHPGKSGFETEKPGSIDDVSEFLEEKESGFGMLKAVRHSAVIEGRMPGWDVMPKPRGTDQAEWLSS